MPLASMEFMHYLRVFIVTIHGVIFQSLLACRIEHRRPIRANQRQALMEYWRAG